MSEAGCAFCTVVAAVGHLHWHPFPRRALRSTRTPSRRSVAILPERYGPEGREQSS